MSEGYIMLEIISGVQASPLSRALASDEFFVVFDAMDGGQCARIRSHFGGSSLLWMKK